MILIVDDDPAVLQLFSAILTRGGHSVITTDSGTKALELLRSQPISLIVLDVTMPQPDGIEVLLAIRAQNAGLKILAVSGFMGGTLLEATKLLGASATLRKSDAYDKLLEVVDELLSS